MKYILIITFLVSLIGHIHAQTIEYTYDDAGNRKERKVLVNILPTDSETSATARNKSNTKLDKLHEDIRKSISIYPNPAQDQLRITIEHELPNATMELFDLSGKLMSQHLLKDFNNSLDISNYSSGEYILVIKNKEFIGQWKVVKIE